MTSGSSHRIALSDPRACRTPFGDFGHLSLAECDEYGRIDTYLRAHRKLPYGSASRYAVLFHRKYFPPAIPQTPGAAA